MTHWQPRLVALDIDGTLLSWVEGAGQTYEVIPEAVYAAVHRAYAAGAHIVLASGRSPHGMTRIADLLDLPEEGADRLWVVASNGAVVFRYSPVEIVHEVTFDAAPAVAAVLAHHPSARVAVEERGRGYRVSKPFPQGELSGVQIITSVRQLVAEPVSRVIIRDPHATAEDFVHLAGRLGLHGTDYVVGWTAWLDLAPVGVNKASGLAHVCAELGLDAADVLAVGDGRNDIEMLRWAGRGVAMGQAVEEVLAAADAVTATVYDDGAAAEISRWYPLVPTPDAGPESERRASGGPVTTAYTFTAPLWQWDAKENTAEPGTWCLMTVPADISAGIRDELTGPRRGFGSVRVSVEAGSSRWKTSVFPDAESGGFVLPVKKAVRVAEDVGEGDELTVTLTVLDP